MLNRGQASRVLSQEITESYTLMTPHILQLSYASCSAVGVLQNQKESSWMRCCSHSFTPLFEVEGSPTEREDEGGGFKTVGPRFRGMYSLVTALTLGSNDKASAVVFGGRKATAGMAGD